MFAEVAFYTQTAAVQVDVLWRQHPLSCIDLLIAS